MPSLRLDRQQRVVIISPSSAHRQLLSSVVKELGFSNVISVSDIKSCAEVMETEPVGWVIGPLVDAESRSVLQLLKLVNTSPPLRGLKISLLVDEQHELVTQAFAWGALSMHHFSPTRESCHEEFTRLFQLIDSLDEDYARVAAVYLTSFLRQHKEYGELRDLLTALLEVYPGNQELILELADILLLIGEDKTGLALLHQTVIMAPELKAKISSICRQHYNADLPPGEPEQLLAEHFGFRCCLVVEPNRETLENTHVLLKQLGFHEVSCHRDPVSALKWLRHGAKPDLIICNWQLPHLPGPVFLYKIRHRLGLNIPLILIHSALNDRDAPLLNELGASRLLAIPFSEKRLFECITWTMKQHTNPTEPGVLKQKVRMASKCHDMRELRRLKQKYLNLPMLLEGDKLYIEAVIAYDNNCFLIAKKQALEAMQKGANTQECLEVLSKALMKLREFDAAIRCLENCSFLAPINVSHLCKIAECQLEKGNDQGYDEALHKAKSVDSESTEVLQTEVKGAIKRGHTEAAKKLLARLQSFKEVLSFMNNRAVTLMRVGNFKESLDLYRKTLDSLPDGHDELKALLHYNLGLGYARANRLEDALLALGEAERSLNPQRLMKAKSLKTRIIASVSAGTPLVIKSDPLPSEQDEKAKLAFLQDMEKTFSKTQILTRSDLCLFRIYHSTLGKDRAKPFLDTPLTFTPRGKLVKDYHKGLMVEDAS